MRTEQTATMLLRTVPFGHFRFSITPHRVTRSGYHDRVFDNLVLSAKQPQSMCPMYASSSESFVKRTGNGMARLSIAIGTLVCCVLPVHTRTGIGKEYGER